MIVTYDKTTQTITLQSDNLKSFVNVDTVTLTSSINCCSPGFSVEIEESDVDTGTGIYIIDNEVLYGSEDLSDGIYSFSLDKTFTSGNGNPINEVACLFIHDGLDCIIQEKVAEEPNLQAQMDFFILVTTQDCPCNCADLCVVYERMMNSLGLDCDICNPDSTTENCVEC